MSYGWICPQCGKSLSPGTCVCPWCPPQLGTAADTAGGEERAAPPDYGRLDRERLEALEGLYGSLKVFTESGWRKIFEVIDKEYGGAAGEIFREACKHVQEIERLTRLARGSVDG